MKDQKELLTNMPQDLFTQDGKHVGTFTYNPTASKDKTTRSIDAQITQVKAEPLFDDEGNYFGFIPLPFAPEK